VDLLGASLADQFDELGRGGPRTIESSMIVTDLPSTVDRIGLSFSRTARSRSSCVGMMNVRPT